MEAYRIVDWWQYEVRADKRRAEGETPIGNLRRKPHEFIPIRNRGTTLSRGMRRLNKAAWQYGDAMAPAAVGIFCELLQIAACQKAGLRGWLLDDKQKPLDCEAIADCRGWDAEIVQTGLKILIQAGWLETAPETQISAKIAEIANSAKIATISEVEGKRREEKGTEGKASEPKGAARQNWLLNIAATFPQRTAADNTTIRDIAEAIEEKAIETGNERLWDQAVGEAKRAARGRKPIALFVAAMKESRYGYEPKRRGLLARFK